MGIVNVTPDSFSDGGEFLDRLYPNRFSDLKRDRIRYGVLGTDGGRIMDDGTIARLDDDTFYVTTTSTGADTVIEWFRWWNAVWDLDAEIVNVTGALAAVNVAGPRARDLMQRVTDLDVSPEGFKYLDARRAHRLPVLLGRQAGAALEQPLQVVGAHADAVRQLQEFVLDRGLSGRLVE
jgi:glycine cleavage system aminomethyltransferase T